LTWNKKNNEVILCATFRVIVRKHLGFDLIARNTTLAKIFPMQCRGIKRSCEIELSEKSIAMTKLQVYMNWPQWSANFHLMAQTNHTFNRN